MQLLYVLQAGMRKSSQLQHQHAFSSRDIAPGLLGGQGQTPGRRKGSDSGIRQQQAAEASSSGGQAVASARQRSRLTPRQPQSSEGLLALPEAAHDSVRWQDSQWQSSSLAEFSASDVQQVCFLDRSV